jgi:UDP-glucose:glycoprotein glucosyltransferase
MRPLYPGQLHTIRKNIHHAVFVLDPSKKEDLSRLVEEIATLVKRLIPIRFGIVLLPGDTPGADTLARIFYHLIDSYGRAAAMKFAEDLLEGYDPTTLPAKGKSLHSTIYSKSSPLEGHERLSYDDLVNVNPDSTNPIANNRAWARRLGVNSKDGAIFGNGQVFVNDDTWINKIGGTLHEDVQLVQKAVYSADISPEDDILEFLLRGTPKSRNEYIFPAQSGNVRFVNLPETLPERGVVYVGGETEGAPGVENATVVWVVDDFDSFSGTELVKAAAEFQSLHPHVTIGLVHNPGSTTGSPNLSLLMYHLSTSGLLDDGSAIAKFRQLLQEVDLASHESSSDVDKILGVKAESWRTVDSEEARKFWSGSQSFAKAAGFGEGERGLVINGRVVIPFVVAKS